MTINEINCDRFDEALPDYLEESLTENDRAAVERHMKECVRCAGLVKDLDRIRTEAAALPDLVPSRDLWAGIESRIAATVIPFAPRQQNTKRFAPWMAAAAAALIVSTAGITYVLTSSTIRNNQASRVALAPTTQSKAPESSVTTSVQQSSPGGTTSEASGESTSSPTVSGSNSPATSSGSARSVSAPRVAGAQMVSRQPDLRGVGSEEVYGREIDMLQKIVSERKTQLDSSTVAIIERNLRIIDAAIAQSKAALTKDPASMLLSEQLTRALDKKVELLRTAALLPAST